jgi:hypothetical protein
MGNGANKMSDFSKLTDKQINEAMQSFPNSMCILDKQGKRKLIDYVNEDAFCFRLIKEHGLDVEWFGDAYVQGNGFGADNENLNRAVLECYLKIKSIKENENDL